MSGYLCLLRYSGRKKKERAALNVIFIVKIRGRQSVQKEITRYSYGIWKRAVRFRRGSVLTTELYSAPNCAFIANLGLCRRGECLIICTHLVYLQRYINAVIVSCIHFIKREGRRDPFRRGGEQDSSDGVGMLIAMTLTAISFYHDIQFSAQRLKTTRGKKPDSMELVDLPFPIVRQHRHYSRVYLRNTSLIIIVDRCGCFGIRRTENNILANAYAGSIDITYQEPPNIQSWELGTRFALKHIIAGQISPKHSR